MSPIVLALDIGGTKTSAALVEGGAILARREAATPRREPAEAWLDGAAALARGWSGYAVAGVAATGLVRDGRWTALNPDTLGVPPGFPLTAELSRRLRVPVFGRNDAQAAAWGEHRFGAGPAGDFVFLTVSTGIGGGVVAGGRLLEGRSGLAGHIGLVPVDTADGPRPLEAVASGAALARLGAASPAGRGGAPAIAAAAARGEGWAEKLLDAAVRPLARALHGLQLVLDPAAFVIGGGLGLAGGYLRRLESCFEALPHLLRPDLRAAALGADAGLIGIADLALADPARAAFKPEDIP